MLYHDVFLLLGCACVRPGASPCSRWSIMAERASWNHREVSCQAPILPCMSRAAPRRAPATEPIARDYSTWVSELRHLIFAPARCEHARAKAGCRTRVLHRSVRRLARCTQCA